jgi:hypothetical protein
MAFSAGLSLQKEKPTPFRKTVKSKLYSVFRYGLDFLRRNFKIQGSGSCTLNYF